MPGPLTRSIAAKLKAAADDLGISQDQLGKKIGQSQSQVSKYLRGEVALSVEDVDNLCRALGLSLTDVVGSADDETKDRAGQL